MDLIPRMLLYNSMTFLACPLCGRSCALSVWDPEHYEADIETHGVTRANPGFTPVDRISVLGDEEITPRVVHRCIQILDFCINKNPEFMNVVIEELEIKNHFKKTREFFSTEEYHKIANWLISENIARASLERTLRLYKTNEHLTREKIDKLQKERSTQYEVDKILGGLMENCEYETKSDDRWGFIIIIKYVPRETWKNVHKISNNISKDVVNRLKQRIGTNSPGVNLLLNEFLYKRRKTYAERLLEDPSNLAY